MLSGVKKINVFWKLRTPLKNPTEWSLLLFVDHMTSGYSNKPFE